MRVREGAERGCGKLGRARSNVHEEGRGCVGGVLSWERGGVQGVAAMCGRWEERRARGCPEHGKGTLRREMSSLYYYIGIKN